jgi:hypothetical protein
MPTTSKYNDDRCLERVLIAHLVSSRLDSRARSMKERCGDSHEKQELEILTAATILQPWKKAFIAGSLSPAPT